jgi:hypothetical protein
MKKVTLWLAILALAFVSPVMGDTFPQPETGTLVITESLSLSADDSDVALSTKLRGGYLFQVEVFTSADDAVTFTINSALGTQLFTMTTTAATSGEIEQPDYFYYVPTNRTPTYTLSGLGSGTATIEITFIKK